MVADVAVAACAHRADHRPGLRTRRAVRGGPLGVLVFMLLAALWSLAFAGFGYAIALKTGNPAAVQHQLPAVLPVPLPHVLVRAAGAAQRLARRGGGLEPGHLPARRAALGHDARLGVGRARPSAPRHRRRRARPACRFASVRSAAASSSSEPRLTVSRRPRPPTRSPVGDRGNAWHVQVGGREASAQFVVERRLATARHPPRRGTRRARPRGVASSSGFGQSGTSLKRSPAERGPWGRRTSPR